MAWVPFIVALAAWILLLLAIAFTSKQRPVSGPATLTPGPEAPAIVDLLIHRWKPTPTASAATLLDLAARGHIRLVAESGDRLICRMQSALPSEPLAHFEMHLHQHIVSHMSIDNAPAAALLPDPEGLDGKRWHAEFELAVIEEARRLGLVRDRLSRLIRWALAAAAAVPTAALTWWLLSLSNGGRPAVGDVEAAVVAFPLLTCVVAAIGLFVAGRVLHGVQGTNAGRVAASRWLGVRAALLTGIQRPQLPQPGISVQARMLAWAVALGVAPDVLRVLTPAESGRVWSSAGGQWHQVWVGAPRRSKASLPWQRRPDEVGQSRTFTGRVIRRWKKRILDLGPYSYEREPSFSHYLVIDDGHNEEALTLAVTGYQFDCFPVDTIVSTTVDSEGGLVDITQAADTRASQQPD
jgi:Predicted membrane protein (DUF2207)